MILPAKATQPTMYFIGVTTTQSSIMKLFPLWARELGLKDAVIKGIDIDIHADPEQYRECVRFIKEDPLSLGALVTTHKIDLYHAARDLFDYLDPYATMFDEISSISKQDGRLEGYAKDPISSGLSMEAFIPVNYWKRHGGEALIMGAGGSALAISSYLTRADHGDDVPSKIIISNRSEARLLSAEKLLSNIDTKVKFEYVLCPNPADNDRLLKALKPRSLVINATGLGKDRPGSPLTDPCEFPEHSLVWELNYRGELDFMHQALKQKEQKQLHVEDGWIYFIHGWTQVIAEVFHMDIKGDTFDKLESIAMDLRTVK
ncbi:shikimate dehydrogenase [Paenibacillus validus]|uniref:shikimate dehydrogenase family protein n=1 Tax=Paenibacillus TaxID=44249 RepID=UPI000FD92780|nr:MULTISPECIES: shikimate dehydrogenase [Paenibacillus]MED4599228.1 shikimate dehydrogenase [Paenibacillus validus]MED4606465.1 shikimate dehydrogenase [Paenibacillus validus]